MPTETRLDAVQRERRLRRELERYGDCSDVHDLPPIHHYWSDRWLRPKLESVGFADLDDFFLHHLERTLAGDGPRTIVSLGAGNCDFEVQLARSLADRGHRDFGIRCLEVNPAMLERGRAAAQEHRVASLLQFHETDVETWRGEPGTGAVLAVHCLHHFVDLEGILAAVRRSLGGEGVLLVNDMIGRNGHRRWPEALVEVEAFWRRLPLRYRYHHQLDQLHEAFVNWDCAAEENEGVRAQDILPLLVEELSFEVFLAFANVVDVFVDRGYGPNFDPRNPVDRKWIDAIAERDEDLLDRGTVKPTHLVAALRAEPVAEAPALYRHWTPQHCLRVPDRPHRRLAQDHGR